MVKPSGKASDEGDGGKTAPDSGALPPAEALLVAFRQAARHRGSPDTPGLKESDPPIKSQHEPVGETASPEPEVPRSPEEILEATIVAFRTAERRGTTSRMGASLAGRPERFEEGSFPREGPTSEGAPFSKGKASKQQEPEQQEAKDLAPAFRRALSKRSYPSEKVEPPSLEEERPKRGRDGDEAPISSSSSSSGPFGPIPSARPDDSFLWVTAEPRDRSASVAVECLSEPRAAEAEAFLLWGGGDRPYRLLRHIRGHSEAQVYLKPVFWNCPREVESPVAIHVDERWTEEDREVRGKLQETAGMINRQVRTVAKAGEGEAGGVQLRVLRFMATRKHQFTPQRTIENSDGFVYPKLTPLLERESPDGGGELYRVLSTLDDQKLLSSEFVMRQHACRNCGCAFLNFEEVCPYCGAADLDADELVHHFRCAFTGAIHEYKREEGKLVCPKCDRYLKQIGVDYDKPSVVRTCRRCHEEFQNPEVQTTCYRCGHTNPPEQQVKRQIKKYDTTALGEETAIYGLSNSLLSILKRESRVLDYATFQLIVESEAARIERYQRSTSSLLLVRVTDLKQLRMELGERSQEVIEEIATAFDNTLRSSDYLSARDESLYLFLLTETDQDGARRAGERLGENVEAVLTQNLAQPPGLDVAAQPLRPGIDLDSLAEQFLSSRS